ncbi:hypothetical protein [Caldivirga sp. UBA161]|uniref:hypothetical protein n=1 Tax=Caldivirga sp. UBA161 TaxID=1915569 RepID=UPI0025B8D5EB|nr:hypothetical protein [Caldivirga sp. UBA161]
MLRLRRGSRPKVYIIEPSPNWCAAVLRANGVEFIAKRVNNSEVSVSTYLGEFTEAELIRVIA